MYSGAEVGARRQVITFLQDIVRTVVDIARYVVQITEKVIEGDEAGAKALYKRARDINLKADEMKKQFVRELFSMGPIFSQREDFYNLVSHIGEIVNSVDGAAFRIAHFHLDEEVRTYLNDIYNMSRVLFDQVTALRECIYMLSYNPSQVLTLSERVLEYESRMDELYRKLIVNIFHRDYKPMDLLKVLEIATRLENAADTSEKVLDRLIGILLT